MSGGELPQLDKFRTLSGPSRTVSAVLLSAMPVAGVMFVLDVHTLLRAVFYREQYLGIFLALVLGSALLVVPATRRSPRDRVPWYDWVLAALGLVVGLHITVAWPALLVGGLAVIAPERLALGVLAVLLVLEVTRRLTGWVLVIIAACFLFYGRFTNLFPGVFFDRGTSWERLVTYLYLDVSGLLGLPLWVAATTVLAFILFGQLLMATGGAQFLTDFALATVGRFRGGPAKMAVVSSSLFGTMSGSAVANVMVDGMVTVPMMKGAGYPARMAGAIEAVASTGGQLMPPVMGATAFLIAEFLQVPYREIVLAALIPAILYYLLLFVSIDLEAAKNGLRGLPSSEVPALRPVLQRSWLLLVPLATLIVGLFSLNLEPEKAALGAAGSVLGLGLVSGRTRLSLRRLAGVLESTGRNLLDIGATTAIAGFVIGVTFLTGAGSALSLQFLRAGGEHLFVLLLLLAALSVVLGMGMPTGAVYILLAVTFAPAIVQLGIPELAAHMFVFYFGVMSMITPPVALATFAAAAIAGANPVPTGFAAVRLGMLGYIVPFLFVYEPALLLKGPPEDVLLNSVTAIVGTGLLGVALVGFLFRPLGYLRRAVLALAGLALLMPVTVTEYAWLVNVVGLSVGLALAFHEWRWGKQEAMEAPKAVGMQTSR